MLEAIARGWENFVARPEGPLNLRFIIQPLLAIIMATRAGLQDARDGRPAFLWASLTDADERRALLHKGWKDLRTPLLASLTLDAVYQVVVHQGIYLLEMLFTATLLVLVPYVILRGPINRLARFLGRPRQSARTR